MIRENTIRALASVLLTASVLILSITFLLLKKQEFSENENRYLEPLPALTWESVKSGQYMENINSYLCDHFPFRDFFIGLKTRTEITLGRREINQVFIGRDGYLIEKYQKPVNTEQISRTLKTFGEKEELGHAIGKQFRASLAVTDEGLAKAIKKNLIHE